ncbi:MAG: hypothetical protein MZV63_33655 [Marinilabiliales bacterium]|nr:hypothetical protein [Marinilabiliales bacterium]
MRIFRSLAGDMAHLVKKYRGSLSGEHGDGRLRGEFIPLMLGKHNYNLLKVLKKTLGSIQCFQSRQNHRHSPDYGEPETFIRCKSQNTRESV